MAEDMVDNAYLPGLPNGNAREQAKVLVRQLRRSANELTSHSIGGSRKGDIP